MEKKIAEHNRAVREMIEERHKLELAINKKLLEEGDVLKFEEIMAFMKHHGLKRIWFRDGMGISKVYGGEPFDFDGLSVDLRATGTINSRRLLDLLSKAAEAEYAERYRYTDDGDFLSRIVIYTFKEET
ncbi:MAG: hypothetical protein J6M02_02735 [Clostridia bacterium]|nr:hypothetical protein [Clostridia bacterium]